MVPEPDLQGNAPRLGPQKAEKALRDTRGQLLEYHERSMIVFKHWNQTAVAVRAQVRGSKPALLDWARKYGVTVLGELPTSEVHHFLYRCLRKELALIPHMAALLTEPEAHDLAIFYTAHAAMLLGPWYPALERIVMGMSAHAAMGRTTKEVPALHDLCRRLTPRLFARFEYALSEAAQAASRRHAPAPPAPPVPPAAAVATAQPVPARLPPVVEYAPAKPRRSAPGLIAAKAAPMLPAVAVQHVAPPSKKRRSAPGSAAAPSAPTPPAVAAQPAPLPAAAHASVQHRHSAPGRPAAPAPSAAVHPAPLPAAAAHAPIQHHHSVPGYSAAPSFVHMAGPHIYCTAPSIAASGYPHPGVPHPHSRPYLHIAQAQHVQYNRHYHVEPALQPHYYGQYSPHYYLPHHQQYGPHIYTTAPLQQHGSSNPEPDAQHMPQQPLPPAALPAPNAWGPAQQHMKQPPGAWPAAPYTLHSFHYHPHVSRGAFPSAHKEMGHAAASQLQQTQVHVPPTSTRTPPPSLPPYPLTTQPPAAPTRPAVPGHAQLDQASARGAGRGMDGPCPDVHSVQPTLVPQGGDAPVLLSGLSEADEQSLMEDLFGSDVFDFDVFQPSVLTAPLGWDGLQPQPSTTGCDTPAGEVPARKVSSGSGIASPGSGTCSPATVAPPSRQASLIAGQHVGPAGGAAAPGGKRAWQHISTYAPGTGQQEDSAQPDEETARGNATRHVRQCRRDGDPLGGMEHPGNSIADMPYATCTVHAVGPVHGGASCAPGHSASVHMPQVGSSACAALKHGHEYEYGAASGPQQGMPCDSQVGYELVVAGEQAEMPPAFDLMGLLFPDFEEAVGGVGEQHDFADFLDVFGSAP